MTKAAVNFLLGNMHLIAGDDENDSEEEDNKKAVGDVSKKVLLLFIFTRTAAISTFITRAHSYCRIRSSCSKVNIV